MSRLAFVVLLICVVAGSPAAARVTRVEIAERSSYANGRSFEGVGPYERLVGRVHFAVDPVTAPNRPVIDLELAPRNGKGLVEFSADLEILAPADPARGSGTLLYDVNNRGGKTCLGMFNGGAEDFLMRHGYTLVWSGWIGELMAGDGRLRLQAPVARDGDRPITGLVRAEMVPNGAAGRLNIAHWANHGSYRPTQEGEKAATLTWRQREADARVSIPRAQWRLVITDQPDGGLPLIELALAGGFRAGYIYELIYEAEGPVVQGLGLAGIRDLISFLKHARVPDNPLRKPDGSPAIQRAIGFGVSQSGRCLRQLLYDGFNADEDGRIVFDGLIPHVAGAGLGFFNHRFASPTRHNSQHDNHLYPADQFPFAYGDEKDPFTGRTDGLLRRARAARVVPKVMHVQTSAEYWHRSGSLVHTDPSGRRDADIPPSARIYAIGGAQHGPGSGAAGPPGLGQLPANPTDYRPVLRALLQAMNAWIRDAKEPPESVYPRLGARTLAGWRESESGWAALPGVRYPEVIQRPEFLDHGPDFQTRRRLTRVPPIRKGEYGVRVPACGSDNNERGVLLLPSVAVPVATFTGWNLRSPGAGADQALLSLTGSYIPFARSSREREASGDPRRSLLERYPNYEAYLERYAAEVRRMVSEGYLLQEDLPLLSEQARMQEALFRE